jgi:hypothetical protein
MEWLAGYKTFIVFGVVLLNGILNLFGWGFELPPEWQDRLDIILAAIALILRWVTFKPVLLRTVKTK